MTRYVIRARSPKTGRVLYVRTNSTLATRGRMAKFSSLDRAFEVARGLIEKMPELRAYNLHAEPCPPIKKNPHRSKSVKKNPSGYARARDSMLAEWDRAAEKFETFTGHQATHRTSFKQTPIRAGFALGKLVAVEYEQDRVGDGFSRYRHDFKKSSRPLLVSSVDGKQMTIVGGRFHVSEQTGINDD